MRLGSVDLQQRCTRAPLISELDHSNDGKKSPRSWCVHTMKCELDVPENARFGFCAGDDRESVR